MRARSIRPIRSSLTILAAGALALLAAPAGAATFAATASASPHAQPLGDDAGTLFTFTITNTGTVDPIAAVEIERPGDRWKIEDCLGQPAGWDARRDGHRCRFKSMRTSADDIPPGQAATFQVLASTKRGDEDRTGTWLMQVSSDEKLKKKETIDASPASQGALDLTAHSFEILDALVVTAPGTPGAPCPSGAHEAIAGSMQTIVLCGRNRTEHTLTPTAAETSLGGTFIGSPGSFSSGPVAPSTTGNVVLGNFIGTEISGTPGPNETIVARTGASPTQTAALTTLTGYEALNRPPEAVAQSRNLPEDTLATLTLRATDPDGDTLTFAIADDPDHGTLGPIGPVTCLGLLCTADVPYTPAPDFFGMDGFTYTANDGVVDSIPASFALDVTPVNDPPSFHTGPSPSVPEDAGPQTLDPWALDVRAGPANESGQNVTFLITGNSNTGLFAAGPHVTPAGALSFTPAADATGSATITLRLQDDGGGMDTSGPQTFTITVLPQNDPPSFSLPPNPDQVILEDSGLHIVSPFATGISPGPPDEAGQAVTFDAMTDNPGLFIAGPTVQPNGDLLFRPAPDAFGAANVTLRAEDDQGGVSPPQSFMIVVAPVNDAPSFDAGPTATSFEDSGPQTIDPWAMNVLAGPANESGQNVTFLITGNSVPGLFAAGPSISPSGALSFTPAPDASGSATITLRAMDDGGTGNGGADTSGPQSFDIVIHAVNDAPTFDLPSAPDQMVLEDAGPQLVAGFATNMSPGPADEAGQSLTFVVGNDAPGLFTTAPTISAATGDLLYRPAPDAFGTATVEVRLRDDGGSANGGVDISAPQTFTITIGAVNDAPSFDLPASPDQQAGQDAGPQSVPGFATNIAAGPANEAGQALLFGLTTDNDPLFSAAPAIDAASGDLTYTPAPGATGSAQVTVLLTDDGGTANGGIDTSPPRMFTISVIPPNAAPVAAAQTVVTDEDTPKTITLSATDADGDALTLQVLSGPAHGTLDTNAPAATCVGSPSTCTGDVVYTPDANISGPDSFAFGANDGTSSSAPATVEIAVSPVNDPPVAGADSFTGAIGNTKLAVGTASPGPVVTIAGNLLANDTDQESGGALTASLATPNVPGGRIVAVNGDGSFTYVPAPGFTGTDTFQYAVTDPDGGTGTGTVSIAVAQLVWYVDQGAPPGGDGRSVAPFDGIAPLSTGGSADALDGAGDILFLAGGAAPYLDGIVLESNQHLIGEPHGLTVDGNLLVPAGGTNATITNASGTGITLADGAEIQRVNVANTSAAGIKGSAIADAVIGDNLSITNAGGNGFELSGGGGGAISFGGTISGSANRAVMVNTHTGGTIDFGAAISGNGSGIFLDGNTGSTISFAGPITLSTGANAAFTATNGGTLTVKGTNTLATTTGTPLTISNTEIGAVGVSFQSVSANGAANGIVLANTGSAGELTVAGTGTPGTGGTIQNTTGADGSPQGIGISLTNTRNVVLNNLNLSDHPNFAISGAGVTNLTLNGVMITGTNGTNDVLNEASVSLTNLTGSASIKNSTIGGGIEDNLRVLNSGGILDRLTLDGATIAVNGTALGDNGAYLEASGVGTILNVTIQNSSFKGARGDLLQTNLIGGGKMDLVLTNTAFSNAHPNIVAAGGGTVFSGNGTLTFDISGNSFRDAKGTAVLLNASGSGAFFTGTFGNNTIGAGGIANSGSSEAGGLSVESNGGGDMVAAIQGNQIRQYNSNGITLRPGDAMGSPVTYQVTVAGNTVAEPGTINTNFNGIQLNNGVVAADAFTTCVDIKTNTLTGSGSGSVAPNNADVRLRQRQSTTVGLPGYAGANNDDAAVVAYLLGRNTAGTGAAANSVPTGGGYTNPGPCTQP